MKLIYLSKEINEQPAVATIGFFDGVHRGHLFLIEQVKRYAAEHQLQSLLVTFDSHPRCVMQQEYRPNLLSTTEEKCQLLDQTGVDMCALLPFTEQLSRLSARDFMEKILRDRLGVKALVIGHDHRFGCGRTDGFEDYVRYGKELGIDVVLAEACRVNDVCMSSSVTRSFLLEGEPHLAAQCLGRHYSVKGKVVHGFSVGRELGFPTANIEVDHPQKLIPKEGVYAVRVYGANDKNTPYFGMLNIGRRPTINNGDQCSIEVHLFHFEGDLYERSLRVEFLARMRDEKHFRSKTELIRQLQSDAEQAKAVCARYV